MAENAETPITAQEYERRDEAALRRALGGSRAAVLSDRALSVGVGVPMGADWIERARRRGLPIVRRSTGGTGVLHEAGDLVWSIVLPRSDPRVGRDYSRAYSRLGVGAARFLGDLGLDAGWTTPPAVSESCCTLGPRGSVLSVGERVVGGAAQHLTRTALLHHGTISVTVDRDLLRALFDLTAPADADRLVGIRELGVHCPGPELAVRLGAAMRTAFD